MQERTVHPRVTRVHHRGEFLKPAEVVEPGLPEFLPPLPTNQPANRLTFARWLFSPDNPLIARVAVNRQWQAFFGRGIVRTLEDFGTQGEYPTHPELLDYLAIHFTRDGWSMKRLHKLIVMSATYQQSDELDPGSFRCDPDNKFLSRAPRVRVDAELVRDVILKAGGLLSFRIGGPSVFPDQPPGVTEHAYGPLIWHVSTGEDRFRRGLYTFNKRTAPYAFFGLFDAPSGEACLARRTYANTPLQALAILNDSWVLASARNLAESAIRASGHEPQAIAERIFRRCATREPTSAEIDWICRFQKKQQSNLKTLRHRAEDVIRSGDKDVKIRDDIDSNELASWMLTARALLNLDETITKP
jgi:hypothetical protein